MQGQRFRIKTPTLAIVEIDGQRTVMYVQVGDVVMVKAGPLDGMRRGRLEWQNSDDVHY